MGVKLVFQSSEKSEVDTEMVCFKNTQEEIFIQLSNIHDVIQFICLDKQTAIKFSKVLRTEIAKMNNDEK